MNKLLNGEISRQETIHGRRAEIVLSRTITGLTIFINFLKKIRLSENLDYPVSCYDEVLNAKDFKLFAQGAFNQEIYHFISSVSYILREVDLVE